MLRPGQKLSLRVERPAAGGRMIARVEGIVVLVADAIPGEEIEARIERVGKGVVYARAESIIAASPMRRAAPADPRCGGCVYNFIDYPEQLRLKGEVVLDALRRIGRIPWTKALTVKASPEAGYRMRARLHLRGGQIGFFHEGSHRLCDARSTRQLHDDSSAALESLLPALARAAIDDAEVELSENIGASARVVHVATSARPKTAALGDMLSGGPLSGFLCTADSGVVAEQGDLAVSDQLSIHDQTFVLRRDVRAFFQGNRFLLEVLAQSVADAIPAAATVVDLYAGVGLLSLSASTRCREVIAVEGDPWSAADLARNAALAREGAVRPRTESVEGFLATRPATPDAVIVDPPRTGMSRQAIDQLTAWRAPHIAYVSCDLATFARDARRLLDSGYELRRLEAFDLFPNTAHVETLGVFALAD